MANRTRTNQIGFFLSDDEKKILDEKFKLSGMKSKSAFLRKMILYGFVYDVDYSYLRKKLQCGTWQNQFQFKSDSGSY